MLKIQDLVVGGCNLQAKIISSLLSPNLGSPLWFTTPPCHGCGLSWLVCAHCQWCSGLCRGWLTGCHGLYWVWLLFSKNKGMVFAMGGCRGLYWVWLLFSKIFCRGCLLVVLVFTTSVDKDKVLLKINKNIKKQKKKEKRI